MYPENPADKSIKLGLVPYHGDRAEAERPAGGAATGCPPRSSASPRSGRDLYLVTVTAPESAARGPPAGRAGATLIEDDPARAARDRGLRQGYKTPVWINGNIHGNEWEGTDGALRVIEQLATATDPATADLLGAPGCTSTSPTTRTAGSPAPAPTATASTSTATSSPPRSPSRGRCAT